MSAYGLIKATSRAMRADTITDLSRINNWLFSNKKSTIVVYGQSLRSLENSLALGLERIKDKIDLPKLERGLEFYESIISEIKKSERKNFDLLNK